MSGTQQDALDAAVNALAALVRMGADFKNQSLTKESIQEKVDMAVNFARSEGHAVEDLDLELLVGTVEMQFVISQPEAKRLDGQDINHIPWLAQKKSQIFTKHGFWDNYRRLLETRIAEIPRTRLDEVTDMILDGLEDPARPGQWDRRGLVMGSVQSGKTNNYIGLLCKAADAGYKLIVVLAGGHNDLRAQTQFRVDEAMVGRDTRQGLKSTVTVGVGLELEHKPVMSLTSATDDGEFHSNTAASVGFDFGNLELPTILVVKKHHQVLANLYDWIQANAHKPHGYERVPDIPLLLLDDEADYASIDTNSQTDEDASPTATNRQIRRILHLFDQSAYVGYTATPFANILIDRDRTDDVFGDDLFPRDFLIALEPPENYVGPERVFGLTSQGDTDEPPRMPLVSDVLDANEWIPPTHKSDVVVQEESFPDSLKRAIASFVLSCAARRLRGQGNKHNSMLVHVTPFKDPQRQVRDQVANNLAELKNHILYDNKPGHPTMEMLRAIWNEDFLPAMTELEEQQIDGAGPHRFDEVESELAAAVAAIDVRVLNGDSADGLDYFDHPEGLSVIVIGGQKLSRGLTLEGLSVSYYLRATRIYDTLMQMGRWFGYRPGYLDLCRMYTTPTISTYYRNITQAVRDLLDDLEIMARQNATPKDFGLRLRMSPGMLVTGDAKMQHGTRQRLTFSGMRPEATSFEAATERRSQARERLEQLLLRLGQHHGKTNSGDYFWHEVSADDVVSFFTGLDEDGLYANARSALPKYLAQFIEEKAEGGLLTDWDILLKSSSATDARQETIASIDVGLSKRQHGGSKNLDFYAPKSIIGSQDEAFNLTEDQLAEASALAGPDTKTGAYGAYYRRVRKPTNGLLILYLLDSHGIKNGEHIEPGPPFTSFAVSFPQIEGDKGVDYTVNTVYLEGD